MYLSNPNAERRCKECEQALVGRSDKKFCTDQCRASYHNRIYSSKNRSVQKIDRILKKNRFLLKKAMEEGEERLNTQILKKRGFDFRFFTHVENDEHGNKLIFCYEKGYYLGPMDRIILIDSPII